MELFSIRIQRTFQLVSTVKDHPRPEQPTDQTQDYANNKPTRKSLL